MKPTRLAFALTATLAIGCSSHPPRELPPEAQTVPGEQTAGLDGKDFLALQNPGVEAPEPAPDQQGDDIADQPEATVSTGSYTARDRYKYLSTLPVGESRALQFYLTTQTFDYIEDGEVLVSGPIASGKARSPTPTGRFSVLSKKKDKESSLYTNELGMQAWMPYSMQFYGNYFVHEGYLPGQPASHGCVRMNHYDARILFERMKIGDAVTVSR